MPAPKFDRFNRPIKPKKWYSRLIPRIPTEDKAFWAAIIVFGLFATCAIGWVLNIIKMICMGWDPSTAGEFVARIIGIPFFPLGIILGFF